MGAKVFAGLRFSREDPAARTLLALDTNHDGRIDPDEVAIFARSQGLDAEAATQEFSSIDANGDGTLDSVELQQVLGSPPAALASQSQSAATASVDSAAETQQLAPEAAVAKAESSPKMLATSTGLISEESRASVRMAAQKVAEDLALEEKEEMEARESDRQAAAVRASSTALAKLTAQNALAAGAKAAHAKADELMAKVKKLEDEAQKAEVRAAALKAKSKLETEQGRELMNVVNSALK